MHVTALMEFSSGNMTLVEKHGVSEIFWSMWQVRFAVAPKVLRRQGRWDGCATLASSPSAACQSSDRLHALATMFVSILVALPQPNVSNLLGTLFATGQSEIPAGRAARQDPDAPADDV